MIEEKRIPPLVSGIISLMWFMVGLLIGGGILIVGLVIGHILEAMILWFAIGCLSSVLIMILQWRNYEVLVEWGILKPKKKKGGDKKNEENTH